MIDVSRGLLGIYQDIEGLEKGPNIIIANFPLRWTVRNMGKLFDEGINLVITSQRAIPSMYMDPKIKNRSRLFYLTANIEAGLHKGKNNWAILLDKDGFVSEGTGDNFFIVKNNHVITPKGTHILRGISRDYIFELCEQLNLDCYEKDIEPYDVYTADEAFITGTPFCMLPVFSMNALSIGEGKRGPIFDKLLNKWSKNVGLDIENQIKIWNANDEKVVNLNQNIATPYSFKKAND